MKANYKIRILAKMIGVKCVSKYIICKDQWLDPKIIAS